MKDTFLTFFLLTFGAAVAEILLPEGERATKKALRFLLSLSLILLLAKPLFPLLQRDFSADFEGLAGEEQAAEDYENILQEAVKSRSAETLRKGISAYLLDTYGLAPEEAAVQVFLDEEGNLSHITVYLSGKGLLQNPHTVERDLTEKLQVKTEVR